MLTPGDRAVVGFIGLGDMGSAMALNLADRAWPLALYARREASLAPFRTTSAAFCANPAEVGRKATLLCLCVVDEAQIDDVMFGENGAGQTLAAGAVVLIHSTVSPQYCRALAARLRPLGISVIDAPVTGAAERGRAGTLTLAVGGDPNAIATCQALLEDQGSNVIHLGPVGSGQVAKLLNNALFIIQMSLVDEMKRVGGALGLDAAKVLDVINTGTASSWAAGFHARSGRDGKAVFDAYPTTYPGGVIEIVRKDIRLFLEQLSASGLDKRRISGIASGAIDSMD